LLFESDTDFLDEDDSRILNISRRLNIYDSIVQKIEDSKNQTEEKRENLGNVIASLEEALKTID
jgi:ribonuclease HII